MVSLKLTCRVFLSRSFWCRAEDPTDEFYEFGVEDYARVMQGLQRKKKHAEKGLRTAKLREQEEQAMAAKFPRTLIRVVFPSREIVQVPLFAYFHDHLAWQGFMIFWPSHSKPPTVPYALPSKQ